MPKNISEMTILITAAASGIGSVMASELKSKGATIIICDCNKEILETFSKNNPDIYTYETDIQNESSVKELFQWINNKFNGLDALINNAGIAGPISDLDKTDFDEWKNTLSVNLNGTFLCSKEAIPLLRNFGGGSIINIGSTSSLFGTPLRSAYSATKWGISGLTKTWAMEYGAENIRVNSICPGSVNGKRIEGVIKQEAIDRNISEKEVKKAYLNQVSIQSFIDPEEIVGMIDYLLSPLAKKVSGQIIAIDGNTEGLSQIRTE